MGTREQSSPPAVRLAGLRKQFGAVRAVDGLSVEIGGGEIVALLGRNGAGKSTTIDMLLGLTKPDAGSVQLLGLPPRRACAAGRVGAMLQSGGLPQGVTVEELLDLVAALYPRHLKREAVLRIARIEDLLGRTTSKLSGGQAQRVRFALAILPDPQLLVLDEPTAAMDVESRREFWTGMREWARSGRSVLFATHYLEEADDFADRIVLVHDGRVLADGTTTEIKGQVGGRQIRCTLEVRSTEELANIPGVLRAEVHGATAVLVCDDSDVALRRLLELHPAARDIEVVGAGLEDAFIELTNATTPEVTA